MKKSTSTILAISLLLGLTSTSHAVSVNTDSDNVDETNRSIQQYRSMVSTATVLSYSEILLVRSTVARKMKFSDDLTDKARYAVAIEIYEEASKAYMNGDNIEAKKLALESIRVIARAVPRYYNRVAKTDSK